jgi:hypothetical protein
VETSHALDARIDLVSQGFVLVFLSIVNQTHKNIVHSHDVLPSNHPHKFSSLPPNGSTFLFI